MGQQQSIGRQSVWAKRLFLLLTVSWKKRKKKKGLDKKISCSWPHFGAWQNIFTAVVRIGSLYLEYWARNPTDDVHTNTHTHTLPSTCLYQQVLPSILFGTRVQQTAFVTEVSRGITSRAGWKSPCMNPDFALEPLHACHLQNNKFHLWNDDTTQ